MVSKKKELDMFSFVRTLFDFKVLQNEFSIKSVAIYSLILLIIAVGLSTLNNSFGYSPFTIVQIIFYSLLGIPFILLMLYGLFHVFLNALEEKRKPFWKSYFAFTAISLPFIIIGHFLNLANLTESFGLITFANMLIFALFVYFIINLIMNFKNYYSTSGYKVAVSLIFTNMFFGTILVVQYLVYLIGSLNV